MIAKVDRQTRREKANAQGGSGILHFRDAFSAEELGNRATMFTVITLLPGDSIGVHAHTENGEIYWILEGELVVSEDGVETVLTAGDAEFCADGHTHGAENRSGAPAKILAVILPNR